MSAGVAQANKFYEEVAATQIVWFGCLPNEILLEFDVSDNKVSLPLWSSKSRIERLKKLNPELWIRRERENTSAKMMYWRL